VTGAEPDEARSRWSLPGVTGAVIAACLSLSPSLLPRGSATQGLVAGIGAAIGYGIGVLLAFLARELTDRERRPAGTQAWRILAVVGGLALLVSLLIGRSWQDDLRSLMGMAREPVWRVILTPLLAAGTFAVLLAAGRGLRRASRWLTGRAARWTSARAARVIGVLGVTFVVWALVSGLVLDGFVAGADRIFSLRDTDTPEGIEQPTSSARSGGDGSLVAWDTLGRQGRSFAGGGADVEELTELRGRPAIEPIRSYAGLASADDVEERVQLAVDDLERAGGFERAHLMVATTTGTGWLDPGALTSFEVLTAGDAATVTIQYSYLPSWLSYLVDQRRAREAGRALFDAVYERWIALPPGERPELYVFGESLGSFGSEAAFSGEHDLRNRTSGALFVGPPRFNPLHVEFTQGRDPGSPEVAPIHRQGRTVRFVSDPDAGIEPADEPWEGPRVLYLQHASDPIVWWGTDLLLRRPDWTREPPGRDVLPQVRWWPLLTFWQITLDLPFALDVPDGHGHRYTRESVDAWAAVLRPDGWSTEAADRLRAAITEDDG
jgi:uncharacterized membrane protein